MTNLVDIVRAKVNSISEPDHPQHAKFKNASAEERELLMAKERFIRQGWQSSRLGNDWKVVERKYHVVVTRKPNGMGMHVYFVKDAREREVAKGHGRDLDKAKAAAWHKLRELVPGWR
jgi:hypothetical protein